MKNAFNKEQRGFVGVVFLAIALIGIVIAAIAAMSRSSSSGTADQAAKSNASIVIKQASDFKSGIDRMIVNGVTPSTITFDATVNSGLFDPTPGAQYAVKHVPPAAVSATTGQVPQFYYSKLVNLPNIGLGTAADYVVTVPNISLVVCQQINKILYNDTPNGTTNIATSAGAAAAWGTTPAAIDDSANTSVYYNFRPEGCIAAGAQYVYYKAIVEN